MSVEAPAHVTPAFELRSWTDRPWTDGVELASQSAFDQFAVRTRNTTYELVILQPSTGDVLVRGGRFFPDYTRARLAGCSLGGAFLKLRAIYTGFLMELQHGGQTIVTTRVQSIAPLRPTAVH
jgi:hypothetical protein